MTDAIQVGAVRLSDRLYEVARAINAAINGEMPELNGGHAVACQNAADMLDRGEREREAIAKAIGAELEDYGDDDRRWWVEADPGPVDCDTLPEAVECALRLAENDWKRLRIALHDAINRPMGVVPASAEPFYSPALADERGAAIADDTTSNGAGPS